MSGVYHFSITPHTPKNYGMPYNFAFQLPVPVSSSIKDFEAIESMVHPILQIKGATYHPFKNKRIHYYEIPSLPREVRLVVFSYFIERTDMNDQFDVRIQYDQPIISVGGRDLVYYVPFLPKFEEYRKQMGLIPHAFAISFEGYKARLSD